MKQIILLLFCCVLTPKLFAQKCLDINIVELMGANLHIPGSAENCLSDCQVTKNEHDQTIIVNYGTEYLQLDNMSKQKMLDFTAASTNSSSQNFQAMAAQMQNMTEDQRKAYAMQMAQQMRSSAHTPPQPETPDVAKLVMHTQSIVVSQLKPLDDELAAKVRKIADDEKQARDAVKQPEKCPGTGKVGLPSCSCANGRAGTYWGQITNIQNTYDAEKAQLLQSYIPKIKALVSQVDDNIKKLHEGDDVKTVTFKRMLLSAQSGAFGIAFDITGATIEDIRKSGADAAVNKQNCNDGVYDLGCQK